MPGMGDVECSFDEEIHQDIIPSFPQESKWFFPYMLQLETDCEIVREKWFGYKPNAPNGQGFMDDLPKKQKCKRQILAASEDNMIHVEDDTQANSKAKKGKHVKRALSKEFEDNEEDLHFNVCVFLNVETLPIACLSNRPVKKMPPKVTSRSPFLFSSFKNYDNFLAMISQGVGTCPDCLVKSSMEWRFD
jgi:hypothetical protein